MRSRFALIAGLAVSSCQTASDPAPEARVARVARALDAGSPTVELLNSEMSDRRESFAGVALGEGRALLCGGSWSDEAVTEPNKSCDYFSLETRSFQSAPPLLVARAFLSLTRTAPGVTCAVGGVDAKTFVYTDSVECLVDGGTAFRAEQKLSVSRAAHTADFLPQSRRVVVVGGYSDTGNPVEDDIATPDINTGAIAAWQKQASVARTAHSSTLVGDELIILGGFAFGEYVRSTQVQRVSFDGGTFRRQALTAIPARHNHTAALIDTPAGPRILVAGGHQRAEDDPNDTNLQLAVESLLYSPTGSGQVEAIAGLQTPRYQHAMAVVAGRAVVSGGYDSLQRLVNSVEVYDPTAQRWFYLDPLTAPRRNHVMVAVDERTVLIAGGSARTEVADIVGLSSAELLMPHLQGEPCDPKSKQCITGYCVDGVCCDTACEGSCQRCNSPKQVGKCVADWTGDPIEPDHPACSGDTLGYRCSNGACRTSCGSHADCTDSHHCLDSACVPREKPGVSCETTRDCQDELFCVDGVCCRSECGEQCAHCNRQGNCVPTLGVPVGERDACPAPGGECGNICDGTDMQACHLPGAETSCGAAACIDQFNDNDGSVQVSQVSFCAAGACIQEPTSCKGYRCNAEGSACLGACETSADCSKGFACETSQAGESGKCLWNGPRIACETDATCPSPLVCWDSSCCEQDCGDPNEWSCTLPGHVGRCFRKPGVSCSSPEDCADGHCVDGRCCESACDGDCESCDNDEGRCTPVPFGEVREDRVCPADSVNNCSLPVCDGVLGTTCNTCSKAQCDGPDLVTDSGKRISCGRFGCAFDKCLTTCSSSADCNVGNVCDASIKQCVSDDTRAFDLPTRCGFGAPRPGGAGLSPLLIGLVPWLVRARGRSRRRRALAS